MAFGTAGIWGSSPWLSPAWCLRNGFGEKIFNVRSLSPSKRGRAVPLRCPQATNLGECLGEAPGPVPSTGTRPRGAHRRPCRKESTELPKTLQRRAWMASSMAWMNHENENSPGSTAAFWGVQHPFGHSRTPNTKASKDPNPIFVQERSTAAEPREYSEGFVLPEQRGDTKGQGGLGRAWIFFFEKAPEIKL